MFHMQYPGHMQHPGHLKTLVVPSTVVTAIIAGQLKDPLQRAEKINRAPAHSWK